MEATRTAAKQMITRFIRRMEPGAVWISRLGAAGTATLENKIRPSSRGAGRGSRKATHLTTLFLLASAIAATAVINLSPADTRRIGKKVWQNECGGTVAGLTSWNEGEKFASLGIGHFIWYPEGARGPFEESFPPFVRFVVEAKARGRSLSLPRILDAKGFNACPWHSRAEFLSARNSPEMTELRNFLANSIDLQAEFLVQRLQEALPKMLAEAAASSRTRVRQQFDRVAGSANGCYALVDYVNFKGEGVLATERYAGQGWGLLQVLEGMSQESNGPEAVKNFAESAKKVLTNRVRNSPPARNESRWLPGWLNRINTYVQN
jgi:hypothetical protein